MLAEALAHEGHEVYYVTNALPVFFKDFEHLPSHHKINTIITSNFLTDLADEKMDAVFVTPGRSDHPIYYNAVRMAAMFSEAQIFLINFESGNWFNALAPNPRELGDWDHWKRVIEYGGTVLSSAFESQKWAEEFYTEHPETTNFSVWSPPINSVAADKAGTPEKDKRAVIISRLSDPHKGMSTILEVIPEEMAGWTLTIISGTESIDPEFELDIRTMAAERGITLDFSFSPNDEEKFIELAKARILIFPSMFEGYGYPPIEALYCNTEVVAYDLPVIQETCGKAPYYARHGDRDDLREALRRAALDPEAGTRDHRSKVFELANFESAAKRVNELIEEALLPENLTTELTLASAITAPKPRKTIIPQPIRAATKAFLVKQRDRFQRLAKREGRKAAFSKLRNATGLQSDLPRKFSVSETSIDEMGVLSIRGWRLGGQHASRVEARIGDTLTVAGSLRVKRPDLLKAHPSYGDGEAGFEISGRFIDQNLLNEPVEILFYRGENQVDRMTAFIHAAQSNAVLWQRRDETLSKAARGKILIIVANVEDIQTNAMGHFDLLNLKHAAKLMGLKVTLIVNGSEPDIHSIKGMLSELFDEFILADPTKPRQHPHIKSDISPALWAVEKALNEAQHGRITSGVITIGRKLSPLLAKAQNGAHRLAYIIGTNDLPDTLANNAFIGSPSQSVLSLASEQFVAHNAIHIPIHPSAFALPQEPTFGERLIVIPPSIHEDAEAEARSFAKFIASLEPLHPIKVRFLSLNRKDTRREKFGQVTFELYEAISDPDAIYINAYLVALPFFSKLRIEDELILERTLSQALAYARPVFAGMDLNADNLQTNGAIFRTNIEMLAHVTVQYLNDEKPASSVLKEGGFSIAKNSPELAYTEFTAFFGALAIPRLKRMHQKQDALLEQAITSLIQLHPSVDEKPVRIMAGNDLATLNATIAALEAVNCHVEDIHSLRPDDMSGLLKWKPQIQPIGESDAPYVIASLDIDETQALERLLSRRGITSYLLRAVHRACDTTDMKVLKGSGIGRTAKLYTSFNQRDWSTDTPESVITIATEDMILNIPRTSKVFGKIDIAIITKPFVTDLICERLFKMSPDMTVISTIPQDALVMSKKGRVIYIDPMDPPWYGDTGHMSSEQLAQKIIVWVGATQVETYE